MTVYAQDVAETEHLRIRIPGDITELFAEVCARKNLSKQGAIERLLRCWLAQDDVAQSMMVGQVTPSDDLVELVLRRMGESDGRGAGIVVERHRVPGVDAPLVRTRKRNL